MDVGEKLVEQLREVASKTPPICRYDNPDEIEHFGKIITVYCKPFEQFQELMRDAADYIANGVTVQECGNWKYYHKQNKAVCTSCSFERDLDANFGKAIACPNCGAKMIEVSGGE